MLFCLLINLEAWMKATNVFDAPAIDHLLKSIQGYEEVYDKVVQTAWVMLNCHLWHLSEELAVLYFFSPLPA